MRDVETRPLIADVGFLVKSITAHTDNAEAMLASPHISPIYVARAS